MCMFLKSQPTKRDAHSIAYHMHVVAIKMVGRQGITTFSLEAKAKHGGRDPEVDG